VANNNIPIANSADTLSLFFRPGEDKRLVNTNSDSIFTFGDFRIYRDNSTQALTSETLSLSFSSFSTKDTLGTDNFTPPQSYSVNYSELTSPANSPFSYSYFGSFYTEVLYAINNIVETFPYALLSLSSTGNTIYDYATSFNNITGQKTATFKIPYSTLKNQGNIIVNSGSSIDGVYSLVDSFTEFSIQMSSTTTTATTQVINILSYNFSAGTNSYLEFKINGHLEYISGPTTTLPVYIRPTNERLGEYNLNISKLENNLLYGQKLIVPNTEDERIETEQMFIWPKTIDGFSPDSYGSAFTNYKNSILKAATDIDDSKTNIMLKTMIPENFTEMDSSGHIYKNTVQAYAHEFDEIKQFIDGIAYAHSVEYNGEESVPQKFMGKLSNLLGWKLSDSFNEVDLFEYLAGDAGGGTSYSKFSLEIWKRILVNINWLYKKKGTRDALQFIFKLIGAPDCLLNIDEFVYKIQNVGPNTSNSAFTNSPKVNDNGYVQYSESQYIFQEGGKGRGTGEKYIQQWTPEFDPLKLNDNIKTWVGDPAVFGSEDTINTKELCMTLDPAAAIECDVFAWYKQTGTCWDWGSYFPPFSSNTVPFEFLEGCENIKPENMSAMTISQWINFIYANSIDPRNRKIVGKPHTSYIYPHLRNIYLMYYYWSNPKSNKLTFKKLDGFLNLIERDFTLYTLQLVPATTILECQGTTIRNTVFNRQKFVYKEGINDGSEFRVKIPRYETELTPIILSGIVNGYIETSLIPTKIIGTLNNPLKVSVIPYKITANIVTGLKAVIEGYAIEATVEPPTSLIIPAGPPPSVPSS